MDHANPTKLSKDAYYFGNNHEEKLNKFLAGEVPIDPALADRLGETIHIKADEFYERRPSPRERIITELIDYAEGMRQTTKQAKNQLTNAMKAAEVDHIPHTEPRPHHYGSGGQENTGHQRRHRQIYLHWRKSA